MKKSFHNACTFKHILTFQLSSHPQGSVFFALPDGSGLLYNMVGVAEAPKAAGNITRDIPSKTHYTESMPVSNWLKRPQRLANKCLVIIFTPISPPPPPPPASFFFASLFRILFIGFVFEEYIMTCHPF